MVLESVCNIFQFLRLLTTCQSIFLMCNTFSLLYVKWLSLKVNLKWNWHIWNYLPYFETIYLICYEVFCFIHPSLFYVIFHILDKWILKYSKNKLNPSCLSLSYILFNTLKFLKVHSARGLPYFLADLNCFIVSNFFALFSFKYSLGKCSQNASLSSVVIESAK